MKNNFFFNAIQYLGACLSLCQLLSIVFDIQSKTILYTCYLLTYTTPFLIVMFVFNYTVVTFT